MKIKKDFKPDVAKLPMLRIRYAAMVPIIGIVDMLTMLSFFMNPVNADRHILRTFFLFFAIVGLGFAIWGILWHTTVDGKSIRVRPIIGKKKTVPFANLKKAVIHRRKRGDSIVYYNLIDKNDDEIVKIYPIMKNSGALIERLRRLAIPVDEVSDC